MQDRMNTGHRDAGQEGGWPYRRNARQEGCRTGGGALQERCETGGMQDRRKIG